MALYGPVWQRKIPRDNGKYELGIWVWCHNWKQQVCEPDGWEALFKKVSFSIQGWAWD